MNAVSTRWLWLQALAWAQRHELSGYNFPATSAWQPMDLETERYTFSGISFEWPILREEQLTFTKDS